MRPLIARCHLGLGRANDSAQTPGEARKHVREAIRLFREMGMRSWLEKAEQALCT